MTSQTSKLFNPIKVGALDLQHRIVLAPLTRGRADINGVPASYAVDYYSQRATPGGLLITEGTFVSFAASGRPFSPGIYSKEQIEAWKHVTDAVHAKGALILCQLWALGRIAEPHLVPTVLSPGSKPFFEDDDVERETPDNFTMMTEKDIDDFVEYYRQAALNAMEAGFDGVEIHGANGYVSTHLAHEKEMANIQPLAY
ncbi:hypothetical protein IL306_013391 [Fusarium sp. DS 682]|nr:hypothetical protein IL306_013391 [Fusarium sp. DS 682]